MPRVSSNISNIIYDELFEDISKGKYDVGAVIPSENELAQKYKVTRFFARKALNRLEDKGIVVNKRGHGRTIVRNSCQIKRLGILDHHSLEFFQLQDPAMPSHVYDWQRGAMMACSQLKCTSIYITGESKSISERLHYLDQVLESNIDALLFVIGVRSAADAEKFLDAVKNCGVPALAFSRIHEYDQMDCFYCDDYSVGTMMTEHLVEKGHERIAYISGDFQHDYSYSTSYNSQRYRGYIDTLIKHGLPVDDESVFAVVYDVFEGDWLRNGYEAASVLFERGVLDRITAIVAVNDQMAEGALKKLNELGMKVPDDISIVGFDNDPRCRQLNLTTGSFDFIKESNRIIKKFIHKIENNTGEIMREVISPKIHINNSVKDMRK